MAIPSPLSATNPTMYGSPPTHTVIFGIGDGVELVNMSLLIKFHAQFIYLAAWQVP